MKDEINFLLASMKMKNFHRLPLFFVLLALSVFVWGAPPSPREVVNLRMDAYNSHDISAFMALYVDNVTVYTYPDIALASGKAHLESIFAPVFAEGSISVKILSQMENGNYVINEEVVNYAGSNKKYVSIYKVEEGFITEVRFVRE